MIKRKTGKRKKWFEISTLFYDSTIYVAIGYGFEEAQEKYYKAIKAPAKGRVYWEDHAGGVACVIENKVSRDLLMFFGQGKPTPGCAAHEIFHAAHITFERINSKVTRETEEPFAYLIQWITQEFWERVK